MIRLINRLSKITFLRFLFIGCINTLIGTGLMFFLYNIVHCDYWFSTAMNYIVGSLVSYFLNKQFTFHKQGHQLKTILLFVINIVVCYAVAYGIARPTAHYLFSSLDEKLCENLAMFIGMCFFVILNYLGQKIFVFTQTKS